jgi:hypothetical protein
MWNGRLPGGSGWNWHTKIIWVGTDLEASPYWVSGGVAYKGQFEIVTSQGTMDPPVLTHIWEVKAR